MHYSPCLTLPCWSGCGSENFIVILTKLPSKTKTARNNTDSCILMDTVCLVGSNPEPRSLLNYGFSWNMIEARIPHLVLSILRSDQRLLIFVVRSTRLGLDLNLDDV